ncbi:MAG: DUF2924 domain-containing protein [Candidatus Omnitrophota bacterium]|nr:DUF2924 domain-containing protein [Candidatus Omnitrophota bacterium]
MSDKVMAQIMALKELPLAELQMEYEELFPGQKAPSSNKVFLWRKIAYQLQELEYGGLSVEAQGKIQQLVQRSNPINNKALRPESMSGNKPKKSDLSRDKRLPISGTVITKEYKGIKPQIKILGVGFKYNSKIYKSFTAIAKEVTVAH